MSVAGFVLAGGNSRRMGTDKALLQIDGATLAQRVANLVQLAAGNSTLIGDPGKYGFLGIPVVPDRRPGNGPLAGMEAALLHSFSEWNLIVACDMASLQADFLATLCSQTFTLPQEADCLVPCGSDGRWQPLSALYRRRCLDAFSGALDQGNRKVTEVITSLHVQTWRAPDRHLFQNVNTPEEWNQYLNGRTRQL